MLRKKEEVCSHDQLKYISKLFQIFLSYSQNSYLIFYAAVDCESLGRVYALCYSMLTRTLSKLETLLRMKSKNNFGSVWDIGIYFA